jgi:hypothetical protein
MVAGLEGVKMKRDLDLIRLLLIKVEGHGKVDLSQYSEDQVKYHQALLIEGGLVEGKPLYSSRGGPKSEEIPDIVHIKRLTWEGHEFLDKALSDSTWEKAKQYVKEKGLSLSIEGLKMGLTLVIKQALRPGP